MSFRIELIKYNQENKISYTPAPGLEAHTFENSPPSNYEIIKYKCSKVKTLHTTIKTKLDDTTVKTDADLKSLISTYTTLSGLQNQIFEVIGQALTSPTILYEQSNVVLPILIIGSIDWTAKYNPNSHGWMTDGQDQISTWWGVFGQYTQTGSPDAKKASVEIGVRSGGPPTIVDLKPKRPKGRRLSEAREFKDQWWSNEDRRSTGNRYWGVSRRRGDSKK